MDKNTNYNTTDTHLFSGLSNATIISYTEVKMNPLILLSGGVTTKALTPLLLKRKMDIAVFDPQTAEAQAQIYGERVIPILRGISQQAQMMAYNEATTLTAKVFADSVDSIAERIEEMPEWYSFSCNGLGENLSQWLPGYVHQSFANQIVRFSVLDTLREARKIKMVVTHEDVTEVFGGLAQWAKTRGVPTMHVSHANPYALPEISPDIHETSICDYLAATPHMEQFYRRNGYKGEVRLTGSPLFDRWTEYRKDRDWALRALKLDSSKLVVAYMSSWGQITNAHDDPTRFETVLRYVMTAGFEQLVIKLHPGEAQGIEQNYMKMAEEFGCRCLVTRLYLEPLLACADCVIALGPSNTVVDAACMDVPSVVVQMPGYSIQHDAIPECEPESLKAEVENVLAGRVDWEERREDFLHQMRYSNKATENVAEWIGELCL